MKAQLAKWVGKIIVIQLGRQKGHLGSGIVAVVLENRFTTSGTEVFVLDQVRFGLGNRCSCC